MEIDVYAQSSDRKSFWAKSLVAKSGEIRTEQVHTFLKIPDNPHLISEFHRKIWPNGESSSIYQNLCWCLRRCLRYLLVSRLLEKERWESSAFSLSDRQKWGWRTLKRGTAGLKRDMQTSPCNLCHYL